MPLHSYVSETTLPQYYRTAGSVEVSKSRDWRDFSVDYIEYNPFYRTTHVHAARFTAKSRGTDWGSERLARNLPKASIMPGRARRHSLVSRAKMTEPIEIPRLDCGVWWAEESICVTWGGYICAAT